MNISRKNRKLSRQQRRNRRQIQQIGRRPRMESLEGRLLLDAGGLDPTFDGDGLVLTDIGRPGTSDRGYDAVAYQADGKVLVVGSSNPSSTDFAIIRYNVDGSLDASFGDGGVATIDFGGNSDVAQGVAIDSLGRILVAGYTAQGGATGFDFGVARLTSDGALDTTFDGDGKQTIDFGGTLDFGFGVAVDSQDNVVVAGQTSKGGVGNFGVARLTSTGALDTSFGGDGKQLIDFGGTDDIAYSVVVDRRDYIVVAGLTAQGGATGIDFGVARLTNAGALDPNFDRDGKQTIDFGGTTDYGYSVAVDIQDNVLVAGQTLQGATGYDFGVARLSSTGALDTSFDSDGKQTIDFGGTSDYGRSIAVDSQDNVLVAGQTLQGATGYDFGVARLTSFGALDFAFDGDGKQTVDFGGTTDQGSSVAVDSQDKVLVVGQTYQGNATGNDFGVARLTSAGILDNTFSADGRVTTDIGRPGSSDFGYDAVAYQSDGKVLVVGNASQSNTDFALVRYNVDGSLDTSFGDRGVATIDFGGTADVAFGVALDSQGRIVVAGYANQGGETGYDFAVARLTSVGALDTSFDGDGKQTIDFGATTDFGQSVAVDSYDNVLVAGYTYQGGASGYDYGVARLTSSGALDPSFDGDGRQTIDFDGTEDIGRSVAVDRQNNVLVAGQTTQGGGGSNFGVARLTSTGALDASFDGDGKQVIDFGGTSDYGNSVAVDGQNNVLVAGQTVQGATGYDFGVARLTATGALDTSFDGDGKQTIDFGSHDYGSSVTEDSQGTVLVAGRTYQGIATGWDFGVARLTSTGALDASFDGDGKQTIDFGNTYDLGQSVAVDGQDNVVVAGYSYQNSPTFYDFAVARLIGYTNSPPTIEDAAFAVAENNTAVGSMSGSDSDADDVLTYAISGGDDGLLFNIDSSTGALSFLAAPDYEIPADYDGDNVYQLQITVTDLAGESASAEVTVTVINQASISGVVFVDVNENGLFDANEPEIDGVTVELRDGNGDAVLDAYGDAIVAVTQSGGIYLFEDLDPGDYQLFENQPSGVNDGADILGSLAGTVVANDTMQLALEHVDAFDYAFAEVGQQVAAGDTATIGFWQNKHGQSLIAAGGADLANWLSASFSNVFGSSLVGASGADVAEFYRNELFKQLGKKSAGPAKVDAQFMAVALAAYFTSSNLAGSLASGYGFNVTDTGIGTKVVNVGTSGAAFDAADGTDLTIMQLLLATDSLTDQPNDITGFAYIYDQDGNGMIDSAEATLRAMANEIFSDINEGGDI